MNDFYPIRCMVHVVYDVYDIKICIVDDCAGGWNECVCFRRCMHEACRFRSQTAGLQFLLCHLLIGSLGKSFRLCASDFSSIK